MRVRWLDAWADHDETTLADFVAECVVETVGFLLRDGDVVTLAQERLNAGKTYRCATHIPRAMVQEVSFL